MVACRLAVASGASGANYPCVRKWSSDSVHRIPCVLHMLAAMRGVDGVVTCGAARVLWVSAVRCCIVWCAGGRIRRVLARGGSVLLQNAWMFATGACHLGQVSVGIVAVRGAVVSG